MSDVELKIETKKQEGDLSNSYRALQNLINSKNEVTDFNTKELSIDLNNPLNIECQPSYDGTVNLIINDDKNPPRIINTRFSKIENNRFKIINRNQLEQTNLYREGKIDQQTRLFRNINKIPRFRLDGVTNTGQLKGGNYTFYLKLADDDYNQTDIVAESGQVSIFKGNLNNISSISGTLQDELTDKAISFVLENLDTSFNKFYIYFTRETSDTNGVRFSTAGMITKPYDLTGTSSVVCINGYEDVTDISVEDLNIKYNLVTAAKTQAQVQNMLFFGNVQGDNVNIKDLQNISYFFKVTLKQDSSGNGWVSSEDYTQSDNDDISATEYYNPQTIYYKLGYWPEEMYRLGVVYIMNDDSLSPVFNLRGHNFTKIDDVNYSGDSLLTDGEMNYLERDSFLSKGKYLDNTFGVFRNSNALIIDYKNKKTQPIYYKIEFTKDMVACLKENHVKGYFFVRQKRIPTILCQGLALGIDNASHVPMLYDGTDYFTESFLNSSRVLVQSYEPHIIKTKSKQCSCLLSLDPIVNPYLRSTLDGSAFFLKRFSTKTGAISRKNRHYWFTGNEQSSDDLNKDTFSNYSCIYVNGGTPLKYVNGCSFATKCGAAEDVTSFSFFETRNFAKENQKLLRGIYCPIIGVTNSLIENNIYTIKIPNFSENNFKEYFKIRGKDHSPFYTISDRYSLIDDNQAIEVFRGDCFTNTVSIRMNRNFTDSEVPVNETIVNPDTWAENYKGYNRMKKEASDDMDEDWGAFSNINRADLNTVNLGHWITFKCLSSYNLGLRSEDRSHVDEQALVGNARSFYPLRDTSVSVSNKIEESAILNDGYDATVGQKRNFIAENVPYVQELFDNRVMFSNIQEEGEFRNSYRIFQGLSYKDIDRQYGAIVKFLPWETNILCIFEHGIGILPINEKALIQTSTNQSIHMYGAGVLQNQITLISGDFGSIWPESIIKTPQGVYGVDTYAKKIWRYSQAKGLETISDMKIQQFLNNHIKLNELDKYPIIALRNVKTHYNNYKGDIMFTFYNDREGETWNMCYNERMSKWITRYSWTPLYSENINNIFYSLDQKRAKILGTIYTNKNCLYGIIPEKNEWNWNNVFSAQLTLKGHDLATSFASTITSIECSILKDNIEKEILINKEDLISSLFEIKEGNTLESKTYSEVKTFFETNYSSHVPLWFKINISAELKAGSTARGTITDEIGVISKGNSTLEPSWVELENKFLRNGFYVHGRAGIFNEMSYEDENMTNQILPTKWYDKQEPFEFEFVVNENVGIHKIFDDLVIISNNVSPDEIEYEIEGDVYDFNKVGICKSILFDKDSEKTSPEDQHHGKFDKTGTYIRDREWEYCNMKELITDDSGKPYRQYLNKRYKTTQRFTNCNIKWDTTLNSYSLVINQKCKDIFKYGRRLGNIQYKEGLWYLNIEPIIFKDKHRFYTNDETPILISEDNWSNTKTVRIRDKYAKVRVKYSGKDTVIITALKTMVTNSYA